MVKNMTKRVYNSKVAAAVHETAEGLYEAGVMDKQTMQKFDRMCLTPTQKFTAEEIKNIREKSIA